MTVLQVRPRRISIPKQEEHTKEQKTEKKIQTAKLVVREHHKLLECSLLINLPIQYCCQFQLVSVFVLSCGHYLLLADVSIKVLNRISVWNQDIFGVL